MNKHGGNVWQGDSPALWLDYSANIRPEGVPQWVRRALTDSIANASYYPDPHMRRAQAALAEFLRVDAAFVRPTAGGISAIQLANRVCSEATCLFTPCFCEYEQFSRSPVKKFPLTENGHALGNPADIARGKIPKHSLIWLCNPLNPVGCAFSREQILALLDEADKAESTLAVDEAFIDYCPEYTSADLLKDHPNLLITGSMTKILGIPGVRLGYLLANPAVLEKVCAEQLTWELSCFAEGVACALPENREAVAQDARDNARRREALRGELEALGAFVYPSKAAFLLADFGRSVEPIARRLKEKNILVRQCLNFDGIDDGHHLRLAVKDGRSNQIFIEALREAMTCAENH